MSDLEKAIQKQTDDAVHYRTEIDGLKAERDAAKARRDYMDGEVQAARTRREQVSALNDATVAKLAEPWVQVREGNDWGSRYLEYDRGHSTSYVGRSIRPRTNPVRIKSDPLAVETSVKWLTVRESEDVSDHGHSSVVTSTVLRMVIGEDMPALRSFHGVWVHEDDWEDGRVES